MTQLWHAACSVCTCPCSLCHCSELWIVAPTCALLAPDSDGMCDYGPKPSVGREALMDSTATSCVHASRAARSIVAQATPERNHWHSTSIALLSSTAPPKHTAAMGGREWRSTRMLPPAGCCDVAHELAGGVWHSVKFARFCTQFAKLCGGAFTNTAWWCCGTAASGAEIGRERGHLCGSRNESAWRSQGAGCHILRRCTAITYQVIYRSGG